MIIDHFSDLEELRKFYSNLLNHQLMVPVNTIERLYMYDDAISFKSAFQQIVETGSSSYEINLTSMFTEYDASSLTARLADDAIPDLFVFPYGKKGFRELICGDMVTSLYDRLYDTLYQHKLIGKANASVVAFRDIVITQEMFDAIQPPVVSVEHAFTALQSLVVDNAYYKDRIAFLENSINELLNRLDTAHTQINDRQLTSWY